MSTKKYHKVNALVNICYEFKCLGWGFFIVNCGPTSVNYQVGSVYALKGSNWMVNTFLNR